METADTYRYQCSSTAVDGRGSVPGGSSQIVQRGTSWAPRSRARAATPQSAPTTRRTAIRPGPCAGHSGSDRTERCGQGDDRGQEAAYGRVSDDAERVRQQGGSHVVPVLEQEGHEMDRHDDHRGGLAGEGDGIPAE